MTGATVKGVGVAPAVGAEELSVEAVGADGASVLDVTGDSVEGVVGEAPGATVENESEGSKVDTKAAGAMEGAAGRSVEAKAEGCPVGVAAGESVTGAGDGGWVIKSPSTAAMG